ncbi:MAG: hypothetical protein AMJ84_00085 [Acidithiobacillales bacterium SM23_46]|nr:MAG: hypothetical protein AMJ84_00085 [Acidithiobacillales bacterium SM23_46]KPL29041.1 MAG: hypothetical protein AMJ72_00030 [Acidithiobacillales bacterium SM1_46]
MSRVLVGCEFSGTVRDAFAAAGHDATSCDILPTESPEGQHYTGDVRDIIGDGYHLAIFHPPCTYLAACQLWRCQRDPEREAKRIEALDFVRDLMAAPVERWALENPVGCIGTEIRPADQYVQPYEYGHDHSKKTGLWLHGLPKLEADPADYVAPRLDTYKGKPVKRWANQSPCGADRMGPSDDRGHKRSRFFAGIARAMADQWGGVASVARRAAEPLAEPVQLALI